MENKKSINRSENHCNRCGYAMFGLNEKLTLIGGYVALLCVDCRSDFSLFIKNKAEYLEFIKLHDDRTTIFHQITFDGKERTKELEENAQAQLNLETVLFTISEAFVLDVIEREQKPSDEPLERKLTPEEERQLLENRIKMQKFRLEISEKHLAEMGAKPETAQESEKGD